MFNYGSSNDHHGKESTTLGRSCSWSVWQVKRKEIKRKKKEQTPEEMKLKGVPKRDGSGRGRRANRGRGGCKPPKNRNRRNWRRR